MLALTLVVDMKQAFEGLHDNIKFVIIGCIQQKLFKVNVNTLQVVKWTKVVLYY